MELNITETIFKNAIGTLTSQATELYNRVTPFFDNAKSQLEKSVCFKIADMPSNDYVTKCVSNYVCLMAYYLAIPSLDLIWTNTGFGIVSNNTLAPASKERVEALRHNTLQLALLTKYEMIDELLLWHGYVDNHEPMTFIVSYSQYKQIGGIWYEDIERFEKLQSKFKQAERKLERLISASELNFLRLLACQQWTADWQATAPQKCAIRLIESFVIAFANDDCSADEYLPQILSIVNDEANASSFERYIASSEFTANNMQQYENGKDKPTYFF